MERNDEEYQKELKRRLKVLGDYLEEGKVKFAPHLFEDTKKSLMAVRYGTDGQVDLSTVDARVRSLTMAVTAMQDREDMKSAISLKDIQTTYFEWLENNFGEHYKVMVRRNLTPHDAGRAISSSTESMDYTVSVIPKFMEVLTEFWNNLIDPAYAHLEDLQVLKAVFGGDFFPSAYENIASKCGIYTDTIVLPDPFLKSGALWERWSKENQTYYFIKHALNLLKYKELALAETNIPIVVILPERMTIDEHEQKTIGSFSESDALIHASHVFGRNFSDMKELFEFVEPFETPEKIANIITNPKRVLFDTDWSGTLQNQIQKAIKEHQKEIFSMEHAGRMVALQGYGRMSQANDLLMKSLRLRGTPLIDAPTSWKYFQWKLQYDAERTKSGYTKDLHILRGLQDAASGQMQWLGNIPNDALIEIRKIGAIDEIRGIIGAGIDKISNFSPDDFQESSEIVVQNIQKAFEDHKEQIKELRKKKWKFAGKDIASWLVIGSLEVAAAATGIPIFGLSALAANQVVDIPKLKDIPKDAKKLREKSQVLKRSPVGILFKYGGKA